jgi:hypothetical protein
VMAFRDDHGSQVFRLFMIEGVVGV